MTDARNVPNGDLSPLSSRELDAVMNDAPVAMAVIDNDDYFVRVNRAYCDLTGRDETELLSMRWRDLTHPDDLQVGEPEIAELFAEQRDRFTVEKRYVRGNGETRWTLTSVALVRDESGAPVYRVSHNVDITERKLLEAELTKTARMQAAAIDSLRRLEEAKTAFLTAASHELRAPATVIQGIADSLDQSGASIEPHVRAQLHAALYANATQLVSLLDELLDLDRLTVGQHLLDPTRLDVVALVRRLIVNSSVAGRVKLDGPQKLDVTTDASRVSLIVNNLLSNVAKFAPDGPVRLTLSAIPEGGAVIDVRDAGPGIPPEEHEAVFHPFHRLAVGETQPGVGVGLSLVAQFANLHGGTARIIGTDVGAHVQVTLPDLQVDDITEEIPLLPAGSGKVSEMGDDPAASTEKSTVDKHAAHILIVEDDPHVRAMFRSALVQAGHHVTEATNGDTAYRKLAADTFDLTLLDVELPDANGVGIASAIRSDPRHTAMGIVFVSGDSAIETKLAGLAVGGNDYLAKPVSLRELLGRVDAYLRDRSVWRDSLETSLKARTEMANRILALRTAADLPAVVCGLTQILSESFPVHELAFTLDRDTTISIDGDGDRRTIRLPLETDLDTVGTISVTTSQDDAAIAIGILSDLAPHVAVAAGPQLATDSAAAHARQWLSELSHPGMIRTAIQPIVSLDDGRTVGYEALARFASGRRPDEVIAAAWAQGIGSELEIVTLQRHLESTAQLNPEAWLALNISGHAFAALPPELLADVHRDIVIELTEQDQIGDYDAIRAHAAKFASAQIAVDDTGAGYASLRHIFELRPALVKLDRNWIAHCDTDPVRQTLIRSVVQFASSIGADVVAEGIERQEELDTVRELGATYGQGYLLGRPFDISV